ncbi:acyl-CoA dehydrogenase family protein [Pontixanthobacter aestiaquae]|uniref:Pimeloyl-CoA dehydrogenase small subunit n=1 Tax=Pontixanthobacter aestiaquae TaxID=1509367 RepID=A0A844Z4V5_9SPHN|nr:acyl-CoA dehydrogenase family protein [Pontixanthobacter aestiaquae]MDN3647221.1 acyl-CoA dehydrogenase family protein [Pontixanthobacter aestiaquae]MXO81803.1 pimeloyl-CoA dehydrogenase small subunit [Pontixanthobacter aestiaquae]
MDFNFTEEQTMVRDGLTRLVRESYDFDTRRSVIESDSGWRPELWAQIAEMGLLGMPFSEEDGGFGGGAIDSLVVMEVFGRGLVVEPYVPTVVCAGGFFKHAGSAEQKEEHIGGIVDGSRVYAFAYAEPRGRYDLADLETTAKKDGDGYVLNGHKAVVIAAPWASHLIVTARTSGERRDHDGISVFVVDKNADGVVTRDYPTVDGRRASDIYFENVSVGADALIGEDGKALPLIELVVDEAIAAQCAEACGAMKSAQEMTVEYSRQRKQFGTPIGKFQVLQHRMVDMFVEYEQSVSMAYLATLKLGESDKERKSAVSAAKVRIGQAAHHIGQEAIQIHGGMGMTDELAIGHYFKRLTIFDAEFGNVDHHMKRHIALASD